MTRREVPADLIRQLTAALSNVDSRDLPALLQQLSGRAMPGALDPFAPPPSRRGHRRAEPVTYRIRVDIKGTRPPLWRRLELPSDLYLDQLHHVLQAAFRWRDLHLHQFGSGPAYYSRETEYYLCPYQAEEGEPGIPEEDVRLDEVLAKTGDKLFYLYDFGDDWEHVLKLEAVLPRGEARAGTTCVAGRGADPPEDCGGVGGYELIRAATGPSGFGMTPFDLDTVNERLALASWYTPRGARSDAD